MSAIITTRAHALRTTGRRLPRRPGRRYESPTTTLGPTTRPGMSGLAIALASAATFGASGPFGKALLDAGWSPSAAVLVRVGGAGLVLLPSAIRALRRARLSTRDSRMILAYGVIAVAGAQICYFTAVQYLSVGVALLLEYLAPVMLVGLTWLRTRRAPGTRTLMGSALAMVGLALVLDIGGATDVSLLGVAWGVGAAVCLSTYFVLSARVNDDVPPVLLAGGGLAVGTVAIAALGLLGLMPLHASMGPVPLMGTTTSVIVPIAVLVGISTVIAYLTGILAAGRLGARLASFVGLTEVLFAVFFAWLLLGEVPVAIQLLGGLAILGGVSLVHADGSGTASGPDLGPLVALEADHRGSRATHA